MRTASHRSSSPAPARSPSGQPPQKVARTMKPVLPAGTGSRLVAGTARRAWPRSRPSGWSCLPMPWPRASPSWPVRQPPMSSGCWCWGWPVRCCAPAPSGAPSSPHGGPGWEPRKSCAASSWPPACRTARGGRARPDHGALAALASRGLDGLDNYYTKYLPALVLRPWSSRSWWWCGSWSPTGSRRWSSC